MKEWMQINGSSHLRCEDILKQIIKTTYYGK